MAASLAVRLWVWLLFVRSALGGRWVAAAQGRARSRSVGPSPPVLVRPSVNLWVPSSLFSALPLAPLLVRESPSCPANHHLIIDTSAAQMTVPYDKTQPDALTHTTSVDTIDNKHDASDIAHIERGQSVRLSGSSRLPS